MPASTKSELALAIREMLEIREKASKLYGRLDELWEEIEDEMDPGDTVAFVDARGNRTKYLLVDKFADKAKQWKSVCFTRYDIEVIDG